MSFRELLQRELKIRKSRNPQYSMRALAAALGIHASTLTRIMQGTRTPSAKLVDRVLKHIDIDPSEKSALLLKLYDSPVGPENHSPKYFPLTNDLEALSGWHHFAILSAFEIREFRPTARWLARYFSVPLDEVEKSLTVLENLKFIRRDKRKWELAGVATSSRASTGESLRKIHREYIERAAMSQALARERDNFSGITMAINSKKIPEAIRRIMEFRRNLAEYLCGMEPPDALDEVYRINIQFFSLKARPKC